MVGGGVGGIQAALDLANSGFKVYLVESSPAIGGNMAMLDKTFPTNDCSLCILSPKLVECGRHLNVTLMTMADVLDLQGESGRFTAVIRRRARYVDLERCTGCGVCLEKCPRRYAMHPAHPDEEVPKKSLSSFEWQMRSKTAIARPYAQALPNAPAIDPAMCLKLTKGTCGLCQKACQAGAICYEDKDRIENIEVGAVILAPGYDQFQPYPKHEYGYSRFPDVVTSMEFERILCASGPFSGHVRCPSDGREPKRIAFLQCVGSRDTACRNGYCSSVCCMYAIKEAVIAKEHLKHIDATIFYMDVRAHGKDFDKYYEHARNEGRVVFERARVHGVEQDQQTKQLMVRYAPAAGGTAEAAFDLVVLATGLEPSASLRGMAGRLGVNLNEFGFVWTDPLAPLRTSRPGVFAAGVASGPRDIPETVVQASAAASEAGRVLAGARGTQTKIKEFPEERVVEQEAPRVGVIVCHCGINIAGVVDVARVAEYAKSLPNVVYAETSLYACSQESQNRIHQLIRDQKLNRLVVASCSPRTHEPLFQATLKEIGLNPYLFEMANIRDQCSWIHMDQPEAATDKACDLVRMAVAKVNLAEALHSLPQPVTQKALVVGGGLAGMTAALDIADQGFDVFLAEKGNVLGGNLLKLDRMLDGNSPVELAGKLAERVRRHPRVKLFLNARVAQASGFVGNFETTLLIGKSAKKTLKHGAVVLATGAQESKPVEYGYGKSDRVATQLDLEKQMRSPAFKVPDCVVMIQCVGSRETDRMYCSRVCCSTAIKNAIRLKQLDPKCQVYILYRDIRTYGLREPYYTQARDLGVQFLRFEAEHKPATAAAGRKINVTVPDELTGSVLTIGADMLVLSARVDANPDNAELGKMFKVPLNSEKFLLEAHVKLRPVDFATEGVFMAGMAHAPKSIDETVAQAQAAAARVGTIISRKEYESEPIIVGVNEDLCDGCGLCVPVCDYGALEIVEVERDGQKKKRVKVTEALCKGCGCCAATCPSGAMEQKGYKSNQIMAMIDAALA